MRTRRGAMSSKWSVVEHEEREATASKTVKASGAALGPEAERVADSQDRKLIRKGHRRSAH